MTCPLSTLAVLLILSGPAPAGEAWDWQSGGFGFRILNYGRFDFEKNRHVYGRVAPYRIGGLCWRMEWSIDKPREESKSTRAARVAQGWPLFSLFTYQPLREDFSIHYVTAGYRTGTQLGMLMPADAAGPVTVDGKKDRYGRGTGKGDWVHREFTMSYGDGGEFRVLLSRLSPAVLVETGSSGVRILAGRKGTMKAPTGSWQNFKGGLVPGNPAHFAVPTRRRIEVRRPGADGCLDLSGMSEKWLLMWFGEETYLWGSNYVLYPARHPNDIGRPDKRLYKVDMPMLVVFENSPRSLKVEPEGGVLVEFGRPSGRLCLMPLEGARLPAAEVTAAWAGGLPEEAGIRCRWWDRRLRQFPVTVRESYRVDRAADAVEITERFTFRPVGEGGVKFAPVPPVLASAAREGLPVTFSGRVTDAKLPLWIGPYAGIEGADSYTYTVKGLSKYVREAYVPAKPRLPAGRDRGEPEWLARELEKEVGLILEAGHLAPWWPKNGKLAVFEEMPVWSSPWETIHYLSRAAPFLKEETRRRLVEYLREERRGYPPEGLAVMPYEKGARRERYRVDLSVKPRVNFHPYGRLKAVPANTPYALALYYELTGDIDELRGSWGAIKNGFRRYVAGSDWPTGTSAIYVWPGGRSQAHCRGGVMETNRVAAGAIGLVRLAEVLGDRETAAFGLFLFHKLAASRLAQAKLVRHLYGARLQRTPPDPRWLVKASTSPSGETGAGVLWVSNWRGPQDDVRATMRFDRFGVVLWDCATGNMQGELGAFTGLTPELGRFLRDYAGAECRRWLEVVEENSPTWHLAYVQSTFGTENCYLLPHNVHQIYMAKSWAVGEKAEVLARLTDIPWVPLGDYYYVAKLTEAIRAYRVPVWKAAAGR